MDRVKEEDDGMSDLIRREEAIKVIDDLWLNTETLAKWQKNGRFMEPSVFVYAVGYIQRLLKEGINEIPAENLLTIKFNDGEVSE